MARFAGITHPIGCWIVGPCWTTDLCFMSPGPGPPSSEDSQSTPVPVPPPPSGGCQRASPADPPPRSALDQLSRRHSPGNVLHEFARGGVLANLPSMIAEAGEGEDRPGGERQTKSDATYDGPVGNGHEVLLQVTRRPAQALLS